MFVHLSTPRLGVVGDLEIRFVCSRVWTMSRRLLPAAPGCEPLGWQDGGCHDEPVPFEQGMHELLRKGPCRAICQSAGNYRSADLAVHGWLSRDGEHRDLKWIIHRSRHSPTTRSISGTPGILSAIAIRPPQGSAFMEVRLGEVKDVVYDGAVVAASITVRTIPTTRITMARYFYFRAHHQESGLFDSFTLCH